MRWPWQRNPRRETAEESSQHARAFGAKLDRALAPARAQTDRLKRIAVERFGGDGEAIEERARELSSGLKVRRNGNGHGDD